MMIVKTGKPQPRRMYYICNRKRCENCAKDCHYTLDEDFALYAEHKLFEVAGEGDLYEVAHGKGVR